MEKVSISSCPAKIILFGEQCVVHGARAIATSLDLRTYCKIEGTTSDDIRLELPDIEKSYSWSFDDLKYDGSLPNTTNKKADDLFLQFLENKTDGDKGVIAFLYLLLSIVGEKYSSKGGFKVVLLSDFQPGVGMGSSAAFNVAIATSIIDFFGLIDISNTVVGEHDTLLLGDNIKQEINSWAFESEKIMHGSPSGIDNSICTYGKAISFKKGSIEMIKDVPNIQIIVTNTQVPRSTKKLVANVSELHRQFPLITSPLFESVDAISDEALRIFKRSSETTDIDELKKLEMDLEALIDINQNILNAIGVGHEALNTVVRVGNEFYLHSKLTGAGGGGCAFTLIPRGTSEDSIQEFISKIEENGFKTFRATIGAQGVYIHKSIPSIFQK